MSEPIFCMGKPAETALFQAIERCMLAHSSDITVKHDRTQTAFVRKVQFVWVSLPRRKSDAGAVMLSIGLPGRVWSPRIQYAAEVAPGRWMHHLIIRDESELDAEICGWMEAAWALVGCGRS